MHASDVLPYQSHTILKFAKCISGFLSGDVTDQSVKKKMGGVCELKETTGKEINAIYHIPCIPGHNYGIVCVHQSLVNDGCHVAVETSALNPLGAGAFFLRPRSVELSKLSSKAPLFFTWRLAAAATAGECWP